MAEEKKVEKPAEENEKAAKEEERAAAARRSAAIEEEKAAALGGFQKSREKTPGKAPRDSYQLPKLQRDDSHLSKSPKEPSGMGLYILLLILGIVSVIAKKYVGYDPSTSLGISIIIGFIFLISILHSPEREIKVVIVGVAFAIDLSGMFGLMQQMPESTIRTIIITINVFVWLLAGIILFVIGAIDRWGKGEKIGKVGGLIFALIIGLIFFFLLPALWESPLLYQKQTYDDYYSVTQEQLKKVGEEFRETSNTWGDYLGCFSRFLSDPATGDQIACRKEKIIIRYCTENFPDEVEKQECITREKGGKFVVSGTVDPTLKKPTKFWFEIDKEFFPYNSLSGTDTLEYTANIKFENPRRQSIMIEFSCNFTNKRNLRDNFLGKIVLPEGMKKINGNAENVMEITAETDSVPVTCRPPEGKVLKGDYDLYYEAKLVGLETRSRVTRFFISKKAGEEKKNIRETIERIEGSSISLFADSLAPADFARLNFGIGNTAKEPIISSDRGLVIGVGIENLGGGELLSVQWYELLLDGFLADCMRKENIEIPAAKKTAKFVGLPGCLVRDYPEELKNPAKHLKREFVAVLVYDYLVRSSKEVITISDATD